MLSIIIPTLNEENYLPLLLKSIKAQNFKNYEIIVADAESQDKTREIARSYGCKVTKGGLPAKGRNQGAQGAAGDLFLFLDAEVLLSENFLDKALQEFKRRNLDIAGCSLEPIEEEWMPKLLFLKFGYNILYNLPARFLEDVFPYAASLILVKREIHERLGGFDEDIKIAEDHNYVRKASKIGTFGILKFSTLPLFLRRFQKEGIVRTGLKYLFCNIFNVSLGDVRTDVFKYNFGQYKKLIVGGKNDSKRSIFLLQGLWIVTCYVIAVVGLLAWLIIFLIFTPKLIISKIKKALLFTKEKNKLFFHQ